MKTKLIATIALAGGLSLAVAGTASAAPLGHPKHHHPKPKPHPVAVTQVSGKQLAAALPAASAYGSGYTSSGEADTGGKVLPPDGVNRMSSLPCDDLGAFQSGFGQTAEAADVVALPQNSDATGNLVIGVQDISQFANSSTAWSYIQDEQSKYNSCSSYGENLPQSGSMTISLDSVSGTKVNGYYAFTASQEADIQDSQGDTLSLYINTTVVNAGTNVYTVWELNAASEPVPASLLSSMISKAQALYKG
jgi:hypothetical protein